jgi:16S rRNA (uracil1498-N3)-methyltransferase
MAELPRFFLPAAALQGESLSITGEPLHHLHSVLRLKIGAELLLLDGAGGCCRGRLTAVDRRAATVTMLERWQERECCSPLQLLQALPKGDKFDLVLQKGTELGITRFQPLLSARTVSRPERGRQERWERIVSEAARQSRRPCLPAVGELLSLAEALPQVNAPLRLLLWEESARPLHEVLPEESPAAVAVLVGPEGGLSAEEVATATAAGFVAVHLGPRILRTETAGLAIAAVVQYRYGDWGQAPS